MVIVVSDHCCVVDFLKEASLKVDQVLPVDLHNAGKAVDQSLYFLVVVEFIGDYGGHAKYPCALFQPHPPPCIQAVPREDAQREGDQERLRRVVDQLHRLQTHLQPRDLDGADCAHQGFRDELVAEHLLAGGRGKVLLVDEDGDLLVVASSGAGLAVLVGAFRLGDCLCVEADSGAEGHLLEGEHLLVFFLAG